VVVSSVVCVCMFYCTDTFVSTSDSRGYTVLYSTVQYSTVLYCTVQYSTVVVSSVVCVYCTDRHIRAISVDYCLITAAILYSTVLYCAVL